MLPLLAAALPATVQKVDIACGTQAPGYEPIHVDGVRRVFGGEHANPHSWPWVAALMAGDGATVNCGGTLIDKRWLISAGHCFADEKATKSHDYKVKLGADDHGPSPEPNEPSQQVVGIEKFWVHPNRSELTNNYDITLVKLDKDVTLNEFVRPVCLPAGTDRLLPGEKVVTIGWGATEDSGEAQFLQQVVIDAIDPQTCKDDYPNVPIDDTMVCAGNQTFGGQGSCFGDSGGPLLAHREDKWVLYGIVSMGGIPCDDPKLPTIFGYVPIFVDWVKQIMQSEGYLHRI